VFNAPPHVVAVDSFVTYVYDFTRRCVSLRCVHVVLFFGAAIACADLLLRSPHY